MKGMVPEPGDRLEFKSGGGCAAIFGLVFAGFGLSFFFMAVTKPAGDQTARLMAGIMGGLFALVGLVIFLARSGVVLDRREGQGRRWHGLGVHALGIRIPIKQTVFPLAPFQRVELEREVKSSSDSNGRSSKSVVYPVRLTGLGETLNLEEGSDYQEARAVAERVSKFLNLKIVDSSSGKSVVREAEFLDETLADKARRTGERIRIPIMPPGMRSRIEHQGLDLVIDVPASGVTRIHALGLVLLISVAGISFLFGGRVFPLFIMLSSIPILKNAFEGALFRVDGRDLAVKRTVFGLGRWKRISRDELEELIVKDSRLEDVDLNEVPEKLKKWIDPITAVAGRPRILARSDRASVNVALAVGKEELDYLFALVKSKLIR